jgi:glutathione S-transferase
MEDRIDIKSPMELGGLKSDDYLALNPQGKMPLLVLPDGTALPESEVISQYLVAKYADMGPSLLPLGGPEVRAKAALATRIHDVYITSVQACMYRAMEVQGGLDTPPRRRGNILYYPCRAQGSPTSRLNFDFAILNLFEPVGSVV